MDYESLFNLLKDEEKKEVKEELERIERQKMLTLESDIKRDQRHRELVNFCLYPFLMQGKLNSKTNFFFVCVEPLYDFETKSFDILIFNEGIKMAILVECITRSSNPKKDLEDFFKKIEIINDKKKSLEDLIGDEIRTIDFVISINSIEIEDFKKELENMKKDAIIWESDVLGEVLKLHQNYKKHSYEPLNEALKEVIIPNSIGTINFLPSSHMGTKLEGIYIALYYKMKELNTSKFSLVELCKIISDISMRGHPENIMKKVAESILETGEKYKIFKPYGEESGIKYYTLTSLPQFIKNKYISCLAKENAKNELAKELELKLKDRIPPREKSLKTFGM
jgi:hypothetical protein